LKKFTTILLLTAIFLQTFSSFVIQAEYFLNKGYIATVLCINKEKPKMRCNGKCYLAKKLQEERQEQQAPTSKKEKFEVQPYFLPKQLAFSAFHYFSKTVYPQTDKDYSSAYSHSVFRPPTI
jgi:hypothetical protein